MADIKTEKTVAEELRAAAETQRAGAAQARKSMAALPGPAYPTVDAFQMALGRQFPVSRGMCEHIARWTPEAAEVLASWLEKEAASAEHHVALWVQTREERPGQEARQPLAKLIEHHFGAALTVARVLNGGDRG